MHVGALPKLDRLAFLGGLALSGGLALPGGLLLSSGCSQVVAPRWLLPGGCSQVVAPRWFSGPHVVVLLVVYAPRIL